MKKPGHSPGLVGDGYLGVVPAQGIEPRFTHSKCGVLPLDEAGDVVNTDLGRLSSV